VDVDIYPLTGGVVIIIWNKLHSTMSKD